MGTSDTAQHATQATLSPSRKAETAARERAGRADRPSYLTANYRVPMLPEADMKRQPRVPRVTRNQPSGRVPVPVTSYWDLITPILDH